MDVTQVHLDQRVQCEAPGCLHVASWVTAKILTSPELRVFLGQVMTVRVLSTPRLAVMTRFSNADGTSVVSPTTVVAAVVQGGICKETSGG